MFHLRCETTAPSTIHSKVIVQFCTVNCLANLKASYTESRVNKRIQEKSPGVTWYEFILKVNFYFNNRKKYAIFM